jgi:hypothetical protein
MTIDSTSVDETITALDADLDRDRTVLVADEARDMVMRFLDIVMSGDVATIDRRLNNPSAVGTIVGTMTSEGWSVRETADAVIEVHRVTANLAHQAFIRAIADGYDYATLVEGVHDDSAPWHGAVHFSDLTVAVAATTTGRLDSEALLRPSTLDGLLVCTAHALGSTKFTDEFGWLDFVADTVGTPLG